MKLTLALGLAAALAGAAACLAAPARADEFTPAQKQEMGALIHDYLVNNPEVLREAIQALDKRDKAIAEDQRQKVVASQAGPLFSSKYQATIGNPKASATLVEFFDYNCHFCKGALPDIVKLKKDDPNLKIVLKDYPGPGTRVGRGGESRERRPQSAVGRQVLGLSFQATGDARTDRQDRGAGRRPRSRPRHGQTQRDMESPEVKTGLEEVMQLADALQINGTPTFVVGQDVVVGAVGYDQLKDKIDSVHKCGRAAC